MYATCSHGHSHWGLSGAAGGLVVAPAEGEPLVLLTLRSAAVHQGSTWSIPGGAIDPGDRDAHAAACREIHEELGYDVGAMPVLGCHEFVCGGWTYVTMLFRTDAAIPLADDGWETDRVAWFPVSEVDRLAEASVLHPGFASSWPHLRQLVVNLP